MYPKGPIRLMYRLYRHVFPEVRKELAAWKSRAEKIPNPELRKQALNSINNKSFHCEGGSVYAAAHTAHRKPLISLIVAYQTISDYLDNLCDRSTSSYAENFASLHQSMLDAVSLSSISSDYYRYNEEKDDGGYLRELVLTCHREIQGLPNYSQVLPEITMLAKLYCDLQVHKHVEKEQREVRLLAWWKEHQELAPNLSWNEFAAATGSTLGIYQLFEMASHSKLSRDQTQAIMTSYFPWICSLHILLDYLVDLEEDQMGGDLNFISYYQTPEEIKQRLIYISTEARQQSLQLPDSEFHHMIIDGLLGLYLSDGKVLRQPMVENIAKQLIASATLRTRFFFWNGRGYRGKKAVLQSPPSRKQNDI